MSLAITFDAAAADLVQGSPSWHSARCGLITASRMADVMAYGKSGPLAARQNYLAEKVIERLTGQPIPSRDLPAMQWGHDYEGEARAVYELQSAAPVEDVGLVVHESLPFVGASPDGLVGDDGGLEIKCPMSLAVHLRTLQNGMPSEHRWQIQGNLWVTGRRWWDFVSYQPLFPESLRLYVERVQRDEDAIAKLEAECVKFNNEVEEALEQLRQRGKVS